MGLHLLPESVGNLDSLETLTISGNNLTELPQATGKLSRLRHLSCYENRIFELPPTFASLQKLETAYFIRNNFTSFPQVFYGMPNLKLLDLGGNHLTELPEFIGECITLEKLYINDNYIRQLPEHITNIPLEVVHVAGNALCNPSAPIVTWLNLHDYYKKDAKWQTYQACSYYDYDLRYVNDFLIANGWNSVSAESVITVENGEITGIDISAQKLNGFRSSSEEASDSGHTLVIPYDFVYMKHLRSLNLSGIAQETDA
jgi:Leucine-rich repeat (LRR) protein